MNIPRLAINSVPFILILFGMTGCVPYFSWFPFF